MAAAPVPADAHAFGTRYDLPLPLWLYLAAAGATVALSFVVAARVRSGGAPADDRDGRDSADPSTGAAAIAAFLVRAIGLLAFLLIVVASLAGSPDPFHNVAPTMVWVLWWIGLAYLVAAIGDVWRHLNPWTTVFRSAEWLGRLAFGIRRLSFERPFPAWLDAWPAVIAFWVFAWIELVSGVASEPRILGVLVLAYSVWTWVGMALFGVEPWLARGEAFSLFFGLIGRMGVFRSSPRRLGVALRPPFVGLLDARPQGRAVSSFVVVVLATLTFDGLRETEVWARLLDAIARSRTLRGPLLALHDSGIGLLGFVETVALFAVPILFMALFLACAGAASIAGPVRAGTLARSHVVTLVPIAFAYHLAHYLSYLLFAGQLVVPLASDPLGMGWDLFGTTTYRLDLSVIDARTVWYVAVGAIVTGHVAAVYLAHRTALGLYGAPDKARRSQYPILVLMIGYTMASLWILSQPVVREA